VDYENKFIIFVDILGFSTFVNENKFTLDELIRFTTLLKEGNKDGKLCPESDFQESDFNFEITQISDCLILTSEVSEAGLLKILNHAWTSLFQLMKEGIMCRGYITQGLVYHQDSQIIGPAYQKALDKEKSEIKAFQKSTDNYSTPFVEIDSQINRFVKNSSDDCLEKLFGRLTRSKDDFTVLFPFKQFSNLAGSFISSANFKSKESKKYTEYVRNYVKKFKSKLEENIDSANGKAKLKASYYVDFLDEQLENLDRLDDDIDFLNSSFR